MHARKRRFVSVRIIAYVIGVRLFGKKRLTRFAYLDWAQWSRWADPIMGSRVFAWIAGWNHEPDVKNYWREADRLGLTPNEMRQEILRQQRVA